MLEVLQNKMYTVTPKANPGTENRYPALAAVTDGVLSIGGEIDGIKSSTVSKYDIADNTWSGGFPQLLTARAEASACVLEETVYVFCGRDD